MAKRNIYVYESEIYRINDSGDKAFIGWSTEFAETLFSYLMAIDEKDKVLVRDGEWFFHLAHLKVDKRPENPTHKDCLYGWFEGVKIGITTNLRQLSTMAKRANPKSKDESEIRKTYFYLRLEDGLLLLDNYNENVVTAKRLEEYLETLGRPIFQQFNVRHISLLKRVDTGFLNKMDNFEVIRTAKLRMQVSPEKTYDNSDAIGALQEMSQPSYANYVDIVIGRKNARKKGVDADFVKGLFRKLLNQNDRPIAGVIEGSRSDGGSKITLKGIEEKHSKNFEVDSQGEVLSEPIFEFIIELGNNCH